MTDTNWTVQACRDLCAACEALCRECAALCTTCAELMAEAVKACETGNMARCAALCDQCCALCAQAQAKCTEAETKCIECMELCGNQAGAAKARAVAMARVADGLRTYAASIAEAVGTIAQQTRATKPTSLGKPTYAV